jgi:hypothetical protein
LHHQKCHDGETTTVEPPQGELSLTRLHEDHLRRSRGTVPMANATCGPNGRRLTWSAVPRSKRMAESAPGVPPVELDCGSAAFSQHNEVAFWQRGSIMWLDHIIGKRIVWNGLLQCGQLPFSDDCSLWS